MYEFWENFIEIFFKIFNVKKICEIGADQGQTTKKILNYVKENGGFINVIEPLGFPKSPDFENKLKKYGKLYKDISLNILDEMPLCDAYLIDGDHNWYTVFHELSKIDKIADKEKEDILPLIFLHDVGWPYARRDHYYNKSQIPVQFQQISRIGGLELEKKELCDVNGINNAHEHALIEGGEKNGVLTAVEDFLAEKNNKYKFEKIEGFWGLGILYDFNISSLIREKIECDVFNKENLKKWIIKLERARIQSIQTMHK